MPSYRTTLPSPLGDLTAYFSHSALMGLWIQGQRFFCASMPEDARDISPDERSIALVTQLREWLSLYFSGADPGGPPFELAPRGSIFSIEIWHLLRQIPYGQTLSYGDISLMFCKKKGLTTFSARAVGTAVARNPISIIIPCHRVIKSDRKVGGYAGGAEVKKRLLHIEGCSIMNDCVYSRIQTYGIEENIH